MFVNKNPQSTLKLGQARGVVLMVAARSGLAVGEYAARLVKKAVVGTGSAEKPQVHAMIQRLLPGAKIAGADAADALAVAITHAHHLACARHCNSRHCEERSDEAIQTKKLHCFASLAMTEKCVRVRA